jgi:hypothetical protein
MPFLSMMKQITGGTGYVQEYTVAWIRYSRLSAKTLFFDDGKIARKKGAHKKGKKEVVRCGNQASFFMEIEHFEITHENEFSFSARRTSR